jgi:adenylate cyclase
VTESLAGKFRNIGRNLGDGLGPLVPSYLPVAWKLGLSISLLITLAMTVLGTTLINSQMEHMRAQADGYGRAIAGQLADTAREPMLADDHFTLKVLVNNLVGNHTLRGAALFSPEGEVLDSAGHIPGQAKPSKVKAPRRWQADQTPMTTYYTPVDVREMTAGYAAVTLSARPIEQAQQTVRDTVVTATLIMITFAIIAAFLAGRRLSRPLHHLLQAADAIGSGDLHYRIPERRNDEIGLLIDSYNKMASGLLEKSQVERVLSRFVSPSVARQMMADLQQVKLGGRDVQATVLFADIVGFTELSEQMEPDEVAELLNAYFDAITMAATFYRGTIDKYMGDCAMVVFGVPESDPEHLYHGLCCAIMIQRLVNQLNEERHDRGLPTVRFRIGLNSGHMLAGNLGSRDRMQYTVVGDAVNLASRLSNLAESGQIILPETILQNPNVVSRVRYRRSGHLEVRGKSEPVATYQLDGVHPQSEALMEQRVREVVKQLLERPGAHSE